MGTVPVGRKKRADVTSGPQTFRSPTAVVVWWVWLLFAAANLIDLAVQGRDHLALVAAAILVLATGVAYVAAQRPRVIADTSGVTVVNPLRDHHVGWASVSQVDLADLLRVHVDQGQGRTKVIHSWAVQYSRRRKFAAEAKARRASARGGRSSFGTFGLDRYGAAGRYGTGGRDVGYAGRPGGETVPSAEAEAERIVRVLSEYANAARSEAVWADGTVPIAKGRATGELTVTGEPPETETGSADLRVAGWRAPLTSTWNRTALLALLVPALILLVICLV
jgi:Bacterial PH domain